MSLPDNKKNSTQRQLAKLKKKRAAAGKLHLIKGKNSSWKSSTLLLLSCQSSIRIPHPSLLILPTDL